MSDIPVRRPSWLEWSTQCEYIHTQKIHILYFFKKNYNYTIMPFVCCANGTFIFHASISFPTLSCFFSDKFSSFPEEDKKKKTLAKPQKRPVFCATNFSRRPWNRKAKRKGPLFQERERERQFRKGGNLLWKIWGNNRKWASAIDTRYYSNFFLTAFVLGHNHDEYHFPTSRHQRREKKPTDSIIF